MNKNHKPSRVHNDYRSNQLWVTVPKVYPVGWSGQLIEGIMGDEISFHDVIPFERSLPTHNDEGYQLHQTGMRAEVLAHKKGCPNRVKVRFDRW